MFKNVDSFHAISSSISQELTNIGIEKNKILIIPNCSPTEKIDKFEKKENQTLTLLTIGRFAIKKKGFDLVEKVSKELDKIVNYKWIIIGRNTTDLLENEYIKNNLDKFEIYDQINNDDEIFFPNSKMIEFYKKSNIYANLARVEGSPIVLIDAIASNLPIISFNTRGGDELVIQGVNGFLIDNFNFKEYAEKVLLLKKFKIDSNNELIKKHIKNFDLHANTKKIIDCYKFLENSKL